MTKHQFTYVFQSKMGGHKVYVTDWCYESALEQVRDVLTSPKLVDLIDTITEVN